MKRLNFFIVLTILISVTVMSCIKREKPNEPELTQVQMDEIKSSYEQIAQIADNYVKGTISKEELNGYLTTFKNLPGVENAWIQDETLYVKFTVGGVVQWQKAKDPIIPPYGKRAALQFSADRQPVGNNKACLINQQFNDENRQYCRDIIDELQSSFETAGYNVTIVNGSDANLDFFKNDFNKYGAIFYISHGSFDGTRTWIVTGQEPKDPDNIFDELFHDLNPLWVDGQVSLGTCSETRNGTSVSVSFFTFSDKFVEASYKSNSFQNSLIYLVACQSFKQTNQLGQAFNNKGAGVTIGWDETNCLGQATGKLLFDLLLGGASVEDAFTTLPTDSKVDACEVTPGANLTYYPPEGNSIYLVDNSKITVTVNSPIDGNTYSSRVLTLGGVVTGVSSLTKGIVEVNNIATDLTITGTSFEQPILINSGINTIKVTCFAELPNGQSVYGTKELTVTGSIASLDLFTELRWNTDLSDVDLHLLPPGADINSLWSSSDCYYLNQVTDWGGYLDVDDVDGIGPEHITIPQYLVSGVYSLWVHYYDSHGAGNTSAFVTVSVNNGPMQNFGPYKLANYGFVRGGDLYEVCTIEYPSGTITPVNQYYFLGKGFGEHGINNKVSKR